MTEQVYQRTWNPIYSVKRSRKSKDIKAGFDFYGTSITSWIVKNVCNIVLFFVATDWFSPIIASKVFCIWFLKLVSAIFCQIFIFRQMIALQKLWKMFFISFKKLFSFSRYSNFCIFVFLSFFPCQLLP